ncbi:MAG: MmcQ/YjbR family DNA-binding protein [Rikenellaceae bacterium]|nr:MmcQ/YjbR family DNA-binding protein [Rikenellaceae bacterium]
MDISEFREFCLSLPSVQECTPFDEDTLVFKVGGKIFAFTGILRFDWITVKCLPDEGTELCELYPCVRPAYHMNKRHWIDILNDHDPDDEFIRQRVRESYRLVIMNMPKKVREEVIRSVKEAGYMLNPNRD